MKISGYVVAGDTKQPMPFATVVPIDTQGKIVVGKGTVTNPDGEYTLDVQPGHKLRFGFVGYEQKTVDQDHADMVTLKPVGITLKVATIVADRPKPKPMVQNKDNTLMYAAAALLIVGVAAANSN